MKYKTGDRVAYIGSTSIQPQYGTVERSNSPNSVRVALDSGPVIEVLETSLEPVNRASLPPAYDKAILWFQRAYEAIHEAGGDPPSVLERFPSSLIETLIRNSIYLQYKRDQ